MLLRRKVQDLERDIQSYRARGVAASAPGGRSGGVVNGSGYMGSRTGTDKAMAPTRSRTPPRTLDGRGGGRGDWGATKVRSSSASSLTRSSSSSYGRSYLSGGREGGKVTVRQGVVEGLLDRLAPQYLHRIQEVALIPQSTREESRKRQTMRGKGGHGVQVEREVEDQRGAVGAAGKVNQEIIGKVPV